jgi:ADP-ribose pyrophosphatase YjhB (NUDIX family)
MMWAEERRMRQKRRIAAYGVSYDAAGRVLLVRGSAQDDNPGAWYLPGGGLEHGEHPLRAVLREYGEETGLTAEVVALRDLISDVYGQPDHDLAIHTDRVIYDVRVTGGTLRNEADGTSDLAEWVEPDRLAELRLVPYVAQVLGKQVTPFPPVPETRSVVDPARTRVQRFAAYGVVTDPAGRVLLSQIAPGYGGAGKWHLPGGGTDFGEPAQVALLRELAEETSQLGRVTGLLAVSDFHNRAAMGPENRPMDWHTVRAVFRVRVDEPTAPVVTEPPGGSTAAAGWFTPAQLASTPINEFARRAIADHLD